MSGTDWFWTFTYMAIAAYLFIAFARRLAASWPSQPAPGHRMETEGIAWVTIGATAAAIFWPVAIAFLLLMHITQYILKETQQP